jgi:hypothetical protein
MKSFTQFINESAGKKIAVGYLKGLLKNVNKTAAKKFLEKKIKEKADSDEKVYFTEKELTLLELIKDGGYDQKDFSSKN